MKTKTMAKVEEMVVLRYQIKPNQTKLQKPVWEKVFDAEYSGGNVIQLAFCEHLPNILYAVYINSISI